MTVYSFDDAEMVGEQLGNIILNLNRYSKSEKISITLLSMVLTYWVCSTFISITKSFN